MNTPRVSVVGLGKLGLCFGACLAKAGFPTLGIDVDEALVGAIGRGQPMTSEPGVAELLAEVLGNGFSVTTDHRRAIAESDVTFILVSTTTGAADGGYSSAQVARALADVGLAFRESSKSFHAFVVASTVPPGAMEAVLIPSLEVAANRVLHRDFSICYNPEFVALGAVRRGFTRPDMVLIGESSTEAGRQLEAIHRRLCHDDVVVHRMSLLSAEIAKVSLNAYLTVKIGFANTLAGLCQRIKGADLDAITEAIGADNRIGAGFLRGGVRYGGPCLPRDTAAFVAMASDHCNDAALVCAAAAVNKQQDRLLLDLVVGQLQQLGADCVSILGLAFKPRTSVVTESAALTLTGSLIEKGFKVTVFDSLVTQDACTAFSERVQFSESAEACVASSPVAVLTIPDPVLVAALLGCRPPVPKVIVDCWRALAPAAINNAIRLVALGVHPDDTAACRLGGSALARSEHNPQGS